MAEIVAERYTGASIKRSEDPRILTGAGRYVDDIKLPGMLHAAFVRSPLAHGLVLSVDVSAARALPGVVAVLTGADLEAMTVPGPDPLMALLGWRRAHPGVHPAGHRQGALHGRSRGDRHRREPLPRRGRLRAGGGRL
jgi:CO/xanthine dehydrogenase Mo-binding subunit